MKQHSTLQKIQNKGSNGIFPSQTDFLSLLYDNYKRGHCFLYFIYFNLTFVEDKNKYIFNNISVCTSEDNILLCF